MRTVFCIFFLLVSAEALITRGTDTLTFTEITSGLDDARAIYATTAGNLFITETGRHRILKISSGGQRLDSLGRLGRGDYQFDSPIDIDATNELKIYVSDYNNRRIQIYDRRFQYLSTVSLPQRVQRDISYSPVKLQVNYHGQLFFYDEESQFIYKFNSGGQYEQRFDTRGVDRIFAPSAMASIGDVLYLADSRQNVIHMLSSNGTYMGFFATSSHPAALSVWDNQIWAVVGDEINRFSRNGRLINVYSLQGLAGIKDIAVFRDNIYLLSGQSIYMAEFE